MINRLLYTSILSFCFIFTSTQVIGSSEWTDPNRDYFKSLNASPGYNPDEPFQDRVDRLWKLSEEGDADASYEMGCYLAYGEGFEDTPKNRETGFLLMHKAAEAGHVEAIYTYGILCMEARGCLDSDENKEVGLTVLKLADEMGHTDAAFTLGSCLVSGKGCKPTKENRKLGVKYFQKSAENGDPSGMFAYACALLSDVDRIPSEEDKKLAFYYSKEAYDQGYMDATPILATSLLKARGCEDISENKKLAFEILQAAVVREHMPSMGTLAYLYIHGIHTEVDHDKALFYLDKLDPIVYNYFNDAGYIWLKKGEFKKALENYLEAIKMGSEVNNSLIRYLVKKVHLRSKKLTTQNGDKKHIALKQIGANLESEKNKAIKAFDELSKDLNNLKKLKIKHSKFGSTEGLVTEEEMHDMRARFLREYRGLKDPKDKRESLDAFNEEIAKLSDTILPQTEEILSYVKMQETMGLVSDNGSSFDTGTTTAEKRALKNEAKNKASLLQDKTDTKTKKKNNKKKKKGRKKTPKKQTKPKQVMAQKASQFAGVKLDYKTKAEIPDAALLNAYQVLNVLQSANNLNDVLSKLKKLEGSFDFKEVTPDYANLPEADITYQLRINKQYRVIVGFVNHSKENSLNNNNNAPDEGEYKLYGNKIYICDPHVG